MTIPQEESAMAESKAHTRDPLRRFRPAEGVPCSLLARIRRRLGSDSGGTLVEMAVTLPIMMAMMTGIFSFSIALYQKLQLAEAVTNAGRVLSADRGDTDPCTTATNAVYGGAPGLSSSGMTLTYTLNGVSQGAGVTSCSGTTNMIAGKPASIQASYTCTLWAYGMSFSSCSVSTQVTEIVQ